VHVGDIIVSTKRRGEEKVSDPKDPVRAMLVKIADAIVEDSSDTEIPERTKNVVWDMLREQRIIPPSLFSKKEHVFDRMKDLKLVTFSCVHGTRQHPVNFLFAGAVSPCECCTQPVGHFNASVVVRCVDCRVQPAEING